MRSGASGRARTRDVCPFCRLRARANGDKLTENTPIPPLTSMFLSGCSVYNQKAEPGQALFRLAELQGWPSLGSVLGNRDRRVRGE